MEWDAWLVLGIMIGFLGGTANIFMPDVVKDIERLSWENEVLKELVGTDKAEEELWKARGRRLR